MTADGSRNVVSVVIVWALVSEGCRETVELFVDRLSAVNALDDAVRDVPEWSRILSVLMIDFGDAGARSSWN